MQEVAHGAVRGLKEWPPANRPPVWPVFFGFRIMVGIGLLMLATVVAGWVLRLRDELFFTGWYLRLCQWTVPIGFIAVIAGWTTTEVGRQPWTVFGLLRTVDSVSPSLTGGDVLGSLLLYMAVYLLMFPTGIAFMYGMVRGGVQGEAAGASRRGRRTTIAERERGRRLLRREGQWRLGSDAVPGSGQCCGRIGSHAAGRNPEGGGSAPCSHGGGGRRAARWRGCDGGGLGRRKTAVGGAVQVHIDVGLQHDALDAGDRFRLGLVGGRRTGRSGEQVVRAVAVIVRTVLGLQTGDIEGHRRATRRDLRQCFGLDIPAREMEAHPFEDDDVPLPPGIHDARLAQQRQHLRAPILGVR